MPPSGDHSLQIPGPANIPDRVLRAMAAPTFEHPGVKSAELMRNVLAGMRSILRTSGELVIYPASGMGALEAALVNTLSPGDHILMAETGHFALLWRDLAESLRLKPILIPGNWREAAKPDEIAGTLADDKTHAIKAVCIIQNELSTSCVSPIEEIRIAMDAANHPALLMVDALSSLGSIDLRMDEWRIDVIIAEAQKSLLLPPGLAFNAVSAKALSAAKSAGLPRSYWDWAASLEANQHGTYPSEPAMNMLFGLAEALRMIEEGGLETILARHERHAAATRAAAKAWGLELVCRDHTAYSPSLTAILAPVETNAGKFRQTVQERFGINLGNGHGKQAERIFRVGHSGNLDDLTLLGILAGCEIGMEVAQLPHRKGGITSAMAYLTDKGQ